LHMVKGNMSHRSLHNIDIVGFANMQISHFCILQSGR
jgi:hypothetical protein